MEGLYMYFYCTKCLKEYPLNTFSYKCECGGLFQLHKTKEEQIPNTISLGEIETPMLKRKIAGQTVFLKLDYFMPSGSFKDRGACTTVNVLKQIGINSIVEDSSGNAGAAFAAYCAAAGIKCNIYLPASTSAGKIKQIAAYGANIVKVPGSRDDVSAAIKLAAQSTYYASHVYNPLFFEGTKSLAYEINKQIGIPDYVFVPVGNGTMLLGLYKGFCELGQLPKFIAVQSTNCSPIYNKFHKLQETEIQSTCAEGIAVGNPMRMDEIINSVRKTNGTFIKVDDNMVIQMEQELSLSGIYAESTACAAVAGFVQYGGKYTLDKDAIIVIPLTGSGLKK